MEKQEIELLKAYFQRQIRNKNYYFGDRCRVDGKDYLIDYHGVGFVIVKRAGKGNRKPVKITY